MKKDKTLAYEALKQHEKHNLVSIERSHHKSILISKNNFPFGKLSIACIVRDKAHVEEDCIYVYMYMIYVVLFKLYFYLFLFYIFILFFSIAMNDCIIHFFIYIYIYTYFLLVFVV